MKVLNILMVLTWSYNLGCSQSFGPGYSYELFKNTSNWHLAQAVEKEDSTQIRRIIKQGGLNINLQEPKFGSTLLKLAVGTDKLESVRILLEEGASLKVPDYENNTPIHEATKFIDLKKNSFQILKLSIEYGANVNDTLVQMRGSDTTYFHVPLMGAVENLDCAKILLKNGANMYVKHKTFYSVWYVMLTNDLDETILLAKYLIIDKKMSIPDPIAYINNKPFDIYSLIKIENFRGDSKKEKAKQEILEYLHKIDFPKNQVYNKR
jgi:ankyrin repeat protein